MVFIGNINGMCKIPLYFIRLFKNAIHKSGTILDGWGKMGYTVFVKEWILKGVSYENYHQIYGL